MNQGRAPRSLIVVLVLSLICPTGCAGLRGMGIRRDPLADTKCVLGENPTLDDVVALVNANVDKIQSWKSDTVKIEAIQGGIRLPVSGQFYVEREHRLRLEVTSIAGKEVDFGSNDDIFWIWSKRGNGDNPPTIFYAAHTDLDVAQQQFPIPFEPKWLMEALSVAPLSTEGVLMERAPGIAEIRLVSDHTLPSGQSVRKVVVVDGCQGRVLEHSTYDANNRPLIRVRMGDHRIDKNTGALLPRYVKLDWPQQDMSMVLNIRQIEVNPPTIPSVVWQMPTMEKTAVVNLGGPPGRRTRPAVATTMESKGLSRTALVSPESIPAESEVEEGSEDAPEFELPQMNRPPVNSVELEEPEFAAPYDAEAPTGKASLNDWFEPSGFEPQ